MIQKYVLLTRDDIMLSNNGTSNGDKSHSGFTYKYNGITQDH